ncbi:hypothetical protein SAMN05880501_11764 [Ureibacillus xyleni]|uniref:Uncharacterized protein n=1 Tax=Ureibacillus xyleni TaxID=614648 RepID=A0A285TPH8_9BACL|nr:hypothetical protein SAMN05880501_11764 [Ureibacillus xyleni]
MESKAILFSLTIGRRALEFQVEQEIEGLEGYFEHTVYVIPRNQREILVEFEQRLYNEYKNSSICPVWGSDWDSYELEWNEEMTGKSFIHVFMLSNQRNEFLKKLNTVYKKEYEQIKKEIIETYDDNVARFKEGYEEAFPEHPLNFEEIIPSKQEYEESFQLLDFELDYDFSSNEYFLEKLKEYNAVK